MTSQLNVDTIVDKQGTGGPTIQSPALQSPTLTEMTNTSTYVSDGGNVSQNTVQGLAKAWASVNAGNSYNGSFNMSSLTDNGTGNYKTTFANAMLNDDYAVGYSGEIGRHNGVTASAYTIGRLRDDGVPRDGGAHVTMSGDLA